MVLPLHRLSFSCEWRIRLFWGGGGGGGWGLFFAAFWVSRGL